MFRNMSVKFLKITIFIMFAVIVGAVLYNNVTWQANAKSAVEITLAIGYNGLSLSSDSTYTLNPTLEGICQTDVPGGYCYHASFGMVNPTADGTPYSLTITRLDNSTVR